MTLGELRKTEIYFNAKNIKYFDTDGNDITSLVELKPLILTNLYLVIGTSLNGNTLQIDLNY